MTDAVIVIEVDGPAVRDVDGIGRSDGAGSAQRAAEQQRRPHGDASTGNAINQVSPA